MNSNLPPAHLKLGRIGEDIAVKYLKRKGFKILDRNFKKHYGELDIVALEKDTLVFVEVKTRLGSSHGLPEEALTPWKIREITKTGLYFKMIHPELPESLRIDAVAIDTDEKFNPVDIRYYPNITL